MTAVADAVARGTRALTDARSPDGFWRDFWTPAGVSDAWVTGYVGAVLAASPLAAGRAAAREAWQLLECDRFRDAGWGYGPAVPADADSTCWAQRLAEGVGGGGERTAAAARWLEGHVVAGGVTTYADAGPIRGFLGLPADTDFGAWCAAHDCVTAAVAGLPAFRARLVPALLSAQRADGSWGGYWWFEPAYATALAVEAVRDADPTAAARAVEWARERVRALPDAAPAFTLACLLRVLPPGGAEADECLTRLLTAQAADGRWRGGVRLRVPRPDERTPDAVEGWARWLGATPPLTTPEDTLRHTFTIYSLDQAGVFTTATVLGALQALAPESAVVTVRVGADVVPDALVEAYRRNGHVTIPGALDAAEVTGVRPALVEAVYALDAATAKGDRSAMDRQALVRAEGIWHHGAAARRFVLGERLAGIAARLLGAERVRVFHDQAFFKPPGGGRTPWHQDRYFWPVDTDRILTVWVPLSPVGPASGRLRFVSGSHRLGSLGDADRFNRSDAELAAFARDNGLSLPEPEELPVGSVSAHAGWTLHGAEPNTGTTTREALTVIYFADGARLANPAVGPDGTAYERQAAQVRAKDLARWFPGLSAGDRAVSRENPLVYG